MSDVARSIRSDAAFFFYRGRVALYAILKAMGIGKGDEVILQAFTCLAVPNPIVSIGATPAYVDIDQQTFNMDPAKLEQAITPKTRAILVQHTFGIPANMDPIMKIARAHKLYVIEDCCHTFGSAYAGKEVGTFGDAAFHSYEWGKPVIIGLGGTAVINNPDLKQRMQEVYKTFVAPPAKEQVIINLEYVAHTLLLNPSLYWLAKDTYRFLSRTGVLVGNFRGEELEGKLSPDYNKRMFTSYKGRLFRKLKQLDASTRQRKWVASRYQQLLQASGYPTPTLDRAYDPVYSKYPLLFQDKPAVLEQAREKRVELYDMFVTPIHPLLEHDWKLVGYTRGQCPVAEDTSSKVISLPIHSKMTENQIQRTVQFITGVKTLAWV